MFAFTLSRNPPLIGKSSISLIANECLFFNKYHSKSMAHKHPSYFLFILFRSPQPNTSFFNYFRRWDKISGGFFFKATQIFYSVHSFFPQPFGLSTFTFSTVDERILFIYLLSNYISPSGKIQNRVHTFSGAYHETRQDFAYILPNFPSLFQNMIFDTKVWPHTTPQILDPILGDLQNPVWPQNCTSDKISNPF